MRAETRRDIRGRSRITAAPGGFIRFRIVRVGFGAAVPMPVPKRAIAIALASAVFQTAAPAAVEALTPHFRVLSVVEPGRAEAAAAYLETLRDRFESLGFELSQPPSPRIEVILFSTPDQMLRHAPPNIQRDGKSAGFFAPGVDRMYMTVAWDAPGGPWVALSHEYVHRVFAGITLPLWLSEGLAEYLSRVPIAATSPTPGPADPSMPLPYFAGRLTDNPWLPWPEIWSAERESATAAHPNFRPQSWLLVHLLASEGLDLTQLDPAQVQARLTRRSPEKIEALLRAALEKPLSNRYLNPHDEWRPAPPLSNSPPRFDPAGAGAPAQPRELAPGELRFVLADLHRETQPPEASRAELEALKREFLNRPEPSESLGALEMDQHNYDLAEQHLADAVKKGSRNPRTHYRYSLMLMRPQPSPQQAALAVKHAQLARQLDPAQPVYLLTEAQAHMTAEHWGESAAALARLTQYPDWESRTKSEFRELQRRQQQQLNRLQRDALPEPQWPFVAGVVHGTPQQPAATPPEPASSEGSAWKTPSPDADAWVDPAPHASKTPGRSQQIAAAHSGLSPPFTRQPVPKPLPKAGPQPRWPPHGTILLYGYISGVECRENEKIVTVKTPRSRIRLREPAGAPAKLYSKPKWIKGLECGLGGLEVNVAYKPSRGSREVRGTLVAVIF